MKLRDKTKIFVYLWLMLWLQGCVFLPGLSLIGNMAATHKGELDADGSSGQALVGSGSTKHPSMTVKVKLYQEDLCSRLWVQIRNSSTHAWFMKRTYLQDGSNIIVPLANKGIQPIGKAGYIPFYGDYLMSRSNTFNKRVLEGDMRHAYIRPSLAVEGHIFFPKTDLAEQVCFLFINDYDNLKVKVPLTGNED